MKKLMIASLSILLLLVPVGVVQAQAPTAKKNFGISGMWIGTNSGYENGVYKSSPVRYTITQVNGVALTGVKSWMKADGTWSESESFQGVLYKSGEFHAVDNDGYLVGKWISKTKIRATYLEAGVDQAALVTVLSKASR